MFRFCWEKGEGVGCACVINVLASIDKVAVLHGTQPQVLQHIVNRVSHCKLLKELRVTCASRKRMVVNAQKRRLPTSNNILLQCSVRTSCVLHIGIDLEQSLHKTALHYVITEKKAFQHVIADRILLSLLQ